MAMRVLVFGANGQLGSALMRLYPDQVFGLLRADVDLTSRNAVHSKVIELRPDAIINSAAFTDVDGAENDLETAMAVNGDAVATIAAVAGASDIPLVHVSTDYVFDGSGPSPHRPEDPTAPLNAYGLSKRAGEQAIAQTSVRAAILRTSWVFSETGKNFAKTMLRLGETHDSLRVIDDQVGGPTPANDLAHATMALARGLTAHSIAPDIYHFSGSPDVSWADFAQAIFLESNQKVEIERVSTAAYGQKIAQRPLNSRLDCASFTKATGLERPDWRLALKELVAQWEKGDVV